MNSRIESVPMDYLQRPYLTEDFIIVWLDSDIDVDNYDTQHSIMFLRRIVNKVKTFTDIDQCVDYISDLVDEKVLMIISSNFSQTSASLLEQCVQPRSIYVLCNSELTNERSLAHCGKRIFTNVQAICDALKQDIRLFSNNLTSISVIKSTAISSLDELDGSFMYSQLLKKIILDTVYTDDAKIDLANFFYTQYIGNDIQSNRIKEFEETYSPSSSIEWYTRENFIYSILNKALRTQDTEVVLKMGFFLQDLHNQILELYRCTNIPCSVNVFRGQALSSTDFERIKNNTGGLLSFNNFLSTSANSDVGYIYADSARQDRDQIGVIFKIEIDSSVSSTPYAPIGERSYYQEAEEEILFSMHTIFRIGDTTERSDRLWEVSLKLTNDTDPLLKRLTECMQKEIEGSTPIDRMGKLMIKMAEFNKAEEIYSKLLSKASKDEQEEIAYLKHQLGFVKKEKGDLQSALSLYMDTLEILRTRPLPDDSYVATVYHNIALVYRTLGQHNEAISYFEKTLEIEKKSLPPDDPNLATTYCNIGLLHSDMKEYSSALLYYKKASDIQQNALPFNHPFLTTTYNNIGLVYSEIGECSKALSYYEKTLEIQRKTLPLNHPLLATTYNNIGSTHNSMREFSKALSCFKKAIEIELRCLPLDHPDVAVTYYNIGSLYNETGKYVLALSYYEAALEIQQKSALIDRLSVATSFNAIGVVYGSIGEHSKSLTYCEKALKIQLAVLPSDHLNLSSVYNNIGLAHTEMEQYEVALTNYEEALKIQQKTLPPNHIQIATTYNNIGLAHGKMKEYPKALSFYKKALEIHQKILPPDDSSIAIIYGNMASIYRLRGDYWNAQSYYNEALRIQQNCLSPEHPSLAITYNNIGSLRHEMKDYSHALVYLQKSLDMKKQFLTPDHPSLTAIYNNIGSAYHSIGEYQQSLPYYKKALEIEEKSPEPNYFSLSTIHHSIAQLLETLRQRREAVKHAERAMEYARQVFHSQDERIERIQKYLNFLRETEGEIQLS